MLKYEVREDKAGYYRMVLVHYNRFNHSIESERHIDIFNFRENAVNAAKVANERFIIKNQRTH